MIWVLFLAGVVAGSLQKQISDNIEIFRDAAGLFVSHWEFVTNMQFELAGDQVLANQAGEAFLTANAVTLDAFIQQGAILDNMNGITEIQLAQMGFDDIVSIGDVFRKTCTAFEQSTALMTQALTSRLPGHPWNVEAERFRMGWRRLGVRIGLIKHKWLANIQEYQQLLDSMDIEDQDESKEDIVPLEEEKKQKRKKKKKSKKSSLVKTSSSVEETSTTTASADEETTSTTTEAETVSNTDVSKESVQLVHVAASKGESVPAVVASGQSKSKSGKKKKMRGSRFVAEGTAKDLTVTTEVDSTSEIKEEESKKANVPASVSSQGEKDGATETTMVSRDQHDQETIADSKIVIESNMESSDDVRTAAETSSESIVDTSKIVEEGIAEASPQIDETTTSTTTTLLPEDTYDEQSERDQVALPVMVMPHPIVPTACRLQYLSEVAKGVTAEMSHWVAQAYSQSPDEATYYNLGLLNHHLMNAQVALENLRQASHGFTGFVGTLPHVVVLCPPDHSPDLEHLA